MTDKIKLCDCTCHRFYPRRRGHLCCDCCLGIMGMGLGGKTYAQWAQCPECKAASTNDVSYFKDQAWINYTCERCKHGWSELDVDIEDDYEE